ncbi:MAG: 23S rRNA (pseudouridine(1915)-N(3))-methyltransferase RlmH [Methylocella sp.]
MRLPLICIGRPKAGPERDLAARYIERASAARAICFSGVELREAGESRAGRPGDRMRDEAQTIRGWLMPRTGVIALDENGKQMTRRSLTTELGRARDQGIASAAFVIGGPVVWNPHFLASVSFMLSFGVMTWPQQLV